VKTLKLLFGKQAMIVCMVGLLYSLPIYSRLPTATEIAKKMKMGWNSGNSLEVPEGGETGWKNPKLSQELIDAVSKAGFNTIRIPCAWDSYADQTTLEIQPERLARVKEVIDYCYKHNMYIILNCHWDNGWLELNVNEEKKEIVNKKQKAYWTQIANYLKEYDEHLLFAGANEPHSENAAQMEILYSYHQSFIDAVRATGGNNSSRVLVVQGPFTDIKKTNELWYKMPDDPIKDRLIVEIHYYTPWNFCGLDKDESWGKMFYFWGKNFHSKTNPERNATYGEEDEADQLFKMMKIKFVDKGIPVICGEYSARKRLKLSEPDLSLHLASRAYYYRYITNAMIKNGVIPYYWDNGYQDECALFDRSSGVVTDKVALDSLMAGANVKTPIHKQPELHNILANKLLKVLINRVYNDIEIQLFLQKSGKVNISVINSFGQEVAHFDNLYFKQGFNSIHWKVNKVSPGLYFIKLSTHQDVVTRTFILF
jgi:hypothetical protein